MSCVDAQLQIAEQVHLAELKQAVASAWSDAEQLAEQSDAIHARLIDLYAAAVEKWRKANNELWRIEGLNNLSASRTPIQ
jgi:uncharacterized coiled-coil protein SlyX